MDPIGLATIIAGAAAGAAAGFLLTIRLPDDPLFRVLRAGFVLLCAGTAAVGTLRVYTDLTVPDARVPVAMTPADPLDTIRRDDPVAARVFRDFPQREADLRAALAAAAAAGGDPAWEQARQRGLAEIGLFARTHYLPRATDADLTAMYRGLVTVLRALAKADPKLCHRFITPTPETAVSIDTIRERIGPGPVVAFEAAASRAIINAGSQVPAFDRERARSLMLRIGQEMVIRHGVGALALLSGEKQVRTADDARLACIVAADLYEAILKRPDGEAAEALRQTLLGEQAP